MEVSPPPGDLLAERLTAGELSCGYWRPTTQGSAFVATLGWRLRPLWGAKIVSSLMRQLARTQLLQRKLHETIRHARERLAHRGPPLLEASQE